MELHGQRGGLVGCWRISDAFPLLSFRGVPMVEWLVYNVSVVLFYQGGISPSLLVIFCRADAGRFLSP